ncbi:hypothetical protein CN188_09415 [Sinorhizobium meliloti]|uniref:hypothetical protein n=1 Tax=Rhizobium meliloti TaxID=382 RepID=UPI000FD96387|nr:hypothetical protein [Sinorhizobium meliloti]RVI84189.1 hypothetical protein CN188_09415 [Sinorhizobium meliloti]
MGNVTRHALRVYAALSELKGNDSDVLDALIPFFEPVLQLMNGKIFDPRVFSAGIRKLYKWRFTGDVAESFVPRLERKGFLRKEAAGVWIVQHQGNASETSSSIVASFEQILDEFVSFPPRVTDLLTYDRNRDELADLLIRFLVSMDSSGNGAYMPQLGGLEPAGEAQQLLSELEEGGRPLDSSDRYMCARFVRYLMRNRPDLSVHLARLSSIALLTEVVEDFVKPTHIEQKTDLTVVLDAPIALDLLGCSGKAFQDDIGTIVASLQAIGAKFVVFPVSCVEMQRNLRSMLALPAELRRGYTHNALIRREVSLDFVTAVANNPERALENAGVTVRPLSLADFPAFHRYFTAEQYEDFFQSIQWGNLIQAREHDATCAALVMRLRQGRHSSDVFKCRYVMVTRNPTFVRQARTYALESRMITSIQEGPIIHQRELATAAWLRTGLGGHESIPRNHLLMTCDRVLQVRPEVRNALAAQLERITPERLQQLNLLMLDARSVQKLADKTLNMEAVVTADNAEHLLEAMREATAEELKTRHEAELESERIAAVSYRTEVSATIDRLSGELAAAKAKEAEFEARERGLLNAALIKVNRTANRVEWFVASGLVVLALAGAINFFTGWFQGDPVWNTIVVTAGGLSVIRLIFALLEKPMPGLATLLNGYTKIALNKQLQLRGIGVEAADRVVIKGGRIKLIEPSSEG